MVTRMRHSRVFRVATALALVSQMASGAPLLAQEATKTAVTAGERAIADAKRKLAKARVRVNRTVPAVTPPNIDPMFGLNVTTEILMNARVLPEQLIPTAPPTAEQNAGLARALERLAIVPADRRPFVIDQYIEAHPTSPWRASLLTNAGVLYDREAYFSRAAAYWTQAWELTRQSDEPHIRVLADYALGELLTQMVKFGQVSKLEERLKETVGRDVRGNAGMKVRDAWEGLNMLKHDHHTAIFSGPEALKMLLTVRPIENLEQAVRTIAGYHPSVEGTSMTEVRDLGKRVGLTLSMWRASAVSEFPVPSIVHLRSQHFSTIVEARDGRYRLQDPGLGGSFWVTADALRNESTGFVLTAERPVGAEWREASDGEGAGVVGHCTPGKPSNTDPPPNIPGCPPTGPGSPPQPPTRPGGGQPPPGEPNVCQGMPYYSFYPSSAALVIDDVPLGYRPAVGPAMRFRLSYNSVGYKTPATYGYGNVGPLWTFNTLSFVVDNNNYAVPPYTQQFVNLRGHGQEVYSPSFPSDHPISNATLVQVSHDPPHYERRLPDGTVEVFELADRAASLPARRIFLTAVIDPQGHAVTYSYDSSFRLIAVTDAIGQVTEFDYEHGSDPNLLTKVTDPFGRFATLTYEGDGRLASITDVAGMTSSFTYGGADFIVAMTTPYGTTTFRNDGNLMTGAYYRFIEATDPSGGRERLEFHLFDDSIDTAVPSSEVPTGFSASNGRLDYWNTFYWDKQAMATGAGDRSKAINYNWMLAADVAYGTPMSRPTMHSMKRPLESRVWYRYAGQDSTSDHSIGTTPYPALIGRVLDGGASQVTTLTYNAQGKVACATDPLGRQTTYSYATNGFDLLEVRQAVSGGTDVLSTFADYTSRRVPQTTSDSAGNDTTITYNAAGQPLTITNAKNETTTFTYDATTRNLLTVTGPVSGATTTFTYDGYGRVESVEGPDGYLVEFAYDALDRLTSRTYPDGTTETFAYNRLDQTQAKDRLDRVTRSFYDGYGRLLSTRDPAGRTVSLDWCNCGVLEALIDAKGNRTTWERDVQGRVTREIRADGTTDAHYTYDLAGRLKTITDPKDQVTTYTYNTDNSLASTGFTNETIATPDISHTYDAYYPRALTMVDGNGTTSYIYKAAGTDGAGQLASVDGPFTDDTITYSYDELGRVLTRLLNGTGTEITYDTLGRLSQLEFPIGAFDYTYAGHTGRVSTVTYPNDQTSTYSYLDDEHDFRLQTMHHKNPSAATLSKFDYTYDAVGNITTWRQERAGSAAKIYTFGHDMVDQLTSAVLTDTNSTPTILRRQAWSYDATGNRTVDQTDDAVFSTTHDSLNRLGSRAPGGPIVFTGSLNEEGTVTIDGKPATVDASNNFRGSATLSGATTTITVKAKDYSGNETTKQYEVDASGSTTSYTYDANGNLTSDGTKTYHWNALNQLVEVKEGTTTIATVEYDGAGRRTEKVAAGLTHQYIYDAEDIVEERISGSSSDTIRFYHGAGIDEPLARKNSSDVVTYYLADHLGSVVQETSASGAVILEREYGPWGDLLSGASTAGYAFQGREWDSEIGLYYFRARYYNAAAGAWASDDPIGFAGGPNFTQFVNNNPLRFVDPFGLCGEDQGSPGTGGGGRYKSVREAGRKAVQNANPRSVKEDIEYAGMIYRNTKDDSYDYTEPRPGGPHWSNFGNPRELPPDQEFVGIYHTHGKDSWGYDDWTFSNRDKSVADRNKVPSYLGTPHDAVLEYDPATKVVRTVVRGR